MEASLQPEPSLGPLAIGGVNPLELVENERGLGKLALMVETVFDRLTAVNEAPEGADSRE